MSQEVLYYLVQLRKGDENAYFSLIELDDSYLSELIDLFYRERSEAIQAELVEVIWQHRSAETLTFLQEALHHHNSEVWKTALDGIVAINHPRGIRILEEAKAELSSLNDTSARERLEWIEEACEQIQANLENGTS